MGGGGGQPMTKMVNSTSYHWCPLHKAWTRHKPADCHGCNALTNQEGSTMSTSNSNSNTNTKRKLKLEQPGTCHNCKRWQRVIMMGMPMVLHATWAQVDACTNIVDLPCNPPLKGATPFVGLLGSPHLYHLLEFQSSCLLCSQVKMPHTHVNSLQVLWHCICRADRILSFILKKNLRCFAFET